MFLHFADISDRFLYFDGAVIEYVPNDLKYTLDDTKWMPIELKQQIGELDAVRENVAEDIEYAEELLERT